MLNLKPLLPDKYVCLNRITVIGPEWNKFLGHIFYTRSLQNNYDILLGDVLDKVLLETVKRNCPESIKPNGQLLVFEGQLEDQLKNIRSPHNKVLTQYFYPEVPQDNLSKLDTSNMFAYYFDIPLRLSISEQNEKYQFIQSFDACYLPYQTHNDLMKTIVFI